ncbi:Serine/threonine-protein phosphatase 4 regulatory subunit 2, partial [Leucoagaricus sp. SymC.cos]
REEWSLIRDAVKHKIEGNIKLFLTTTKPSLPPPHFTQVATPNGGLKIAPFPPHRTLRVHLNEKPISFMKPEEAEDAKKYIFEQLDSFDSVPFSVQRLCELCVKPRDHYNSVGKYLRAVEKSILVTSTRDSFPPLTEEEKDSFGRSATMLGSTRQSAPATPLFSPIPFLHEDARRSQSASPPPSPLTLAAVGSISDAHVQPLETKALGLVDEMDDPRPGHLSDHPTAITSTTTPSTSTTGPGTARPLFGGSLEQRFVRSGLMGPASDTMVVDEDKENTQSK